MRAYKGIVENGVVVLIGARLPEGTVVTVTVGEAELLRARITSALTRSRKVRIRLKPTPGLVAEAAALGSSGEAGND
ncbi:hypothetical protein [Deinococcus sp. YIM 77859]|uniref:hypothetical protein n=1 Tax=Deinococcus sp. YIM 77859 TaxID=1540221 RepID=UPI00055125DF|nr:hypothetical protein [Deinococcus sp. YIM 77859]